MKYGASVDLKVGYRVKDFLGRWIGVTGFNVTGYSIEELKEKINKRARNSKGTADVYLVNILNQFSTKDKKVLSFEF